MASEGLGERVLPGGGQVHGGVAVPTGANAEAGHRRV